MAAKAVFNYPLTEPVTLTFRNAKGDEREESVLELNMRTPYGRDFMAIDKGEGEIGKLHAFAAALCDVDVRVINGLNADDWGVIIAKAADFFPASLKG